MKISYDLEVDALYIRLLDADAEVTTQRVSDEVAIDYAPDGRIVSIEVVDASLSGFAPLGERTVTLQNLTSVTP